MQISLSSDCYRSVLSAEAKPSASVVQQHILSVVGNAMFCFVASLTDFPAVKEF